MGLNLDLRPRVCGCDRHGDHDGCSPGCRETGCVAILGGGLDTRACGCTVHSFHGSCSGPCKHTHCGYGGAQGRLLREVVKILEPNEAGTSTIVPPDLMRTELYQWWGELARTEADQVIDKAIEYGSRDLVDIGRDLADCMHRKVTDQQAAELGVYFYLRGKMARATSALIRGEYPSDDTLKDIGVYVRMAQRIRSHGSWPGVGE